MPPGGWIRELTTENAWTTDSEFLSRLGLDNCFIFSFVHSHRLKKSYAGCDTFQIAQTTAVIMEALLNTQCLV